MMNFTLKENKLLNSDIISPEIPYAIFSDELTKDVLHKIVAQLNYGGRVIDILSRYHGTDDFVSITEMVQDLQEVYGQYARGQQQIERENRK